jgi:DNA-binding PucR family transcriptional regulator
VTYDQLHSGDLLNTLKTYLRLQANASAAAEALFLHRSGLLYRLRRIEDLLALRLDVFEHRAAIELALLALDAHPQRQSE